MATREKRHPPPPATDPAPLVPRPGHRPARPADERGRDAGVTTPVAVLHGGLAVGVPSYDAVLAEHGPHFPGADSCRACGFVYTDHPICPAVILAQAGFADLADRVRVVPEADREYGALCELAVAVQRMGARLDVIGASVTAPKNTAGRHRRSFRTRRTD